MTPEDLDDEARTADGEEYEEDENDGSDDSR
jgi:hypothetical protein